MMIPICNDDFIIMCYARVSLYYYIIILYYYFIITTGSTITHYYPFQSPELADEPKMFGSGKNISVCIHVYIQYVLVETYSVLYVYVRIIGTRFVYRYAYSPYLYIFVLYTYTIRTSTSWSGRKLSTQTGSVFGLYLYVLHVYTTCTDPVWVGGLQPDQDVLYVFWSVFCTYLVHNRTYAILYVLTQNKIRTQCLSVLVHL